MAKKITAAEAIARLQSDPAYIKLQAERDAKLAAADERWRLEEAPILADLKSIGCNVESIWDLVNSSIPYPKAIPVLLEHLRRPYTDRVKNGIARALAVPDARYAWSSLVAEYKAAPLGSEFKDGLAIAVAATTPDSKIEELISLTKDRSHGASRLFLLTALRKSCSSAAKRALVELSQDPDLADEIDSWRTKERP